MFRVLVGDSLQSARDRFLNRTEFCKQLVDYVLGGSSVEEEKGGEGDKLTMCFVRKQSETVYVQTTT